MHKRPTIFLSVLCLIAGLLLPFLAAAAQDAFLSSGPISFSGDAHYAYRGTLANRITALDGYFNSSPAVRAVSTPRDISESDIAARLSAFLPTGDCTAQHSSALVITPRQYSAEYRYAVTDYSGDNVSLQIISDEETAIPLRIELHIAPDVMTRLIETTDTWTLLRKYVDLIGLGEAADVYYSESTLLITRTAPIRGVPYSAELTVIPSAGSLFIKLNTVSQN